jgi:ankyrin repeat protein
MTSSILFKKTINEEIMINHYIFGQIFLGLLVYSVSLLSMDTKSFSSEPIGLLYTLLITQQENPTAMKKITELIDKIPNLNIALPNHRGTLLHETTRLNKQCTARYLLTKGALTNREAIYALITSDPESINPSQVVCTPLHIAAYYGNLPMAQLLIDAGADINACTDHRETPLHYTARSDYGYRICNFNNMQIPELIEICAKRSMVAQLLLQNKARLDIKDYDNLTPHSRAQKGNQLVIDLFISSSSRK